MLIINYNFKKEMVVNYIHHHQHQIQHQLLHQIQQIYQYQTNKWIKFYNNNSNNSKGCGDNRDSGDNDKGYADNRDNGNAYSDNMETMQIMVMYIVTMEVTMAKHMEIMEIVVNFSILFILLHNLYHGLFLLLSELSSFPINNDIFFNPLEYSEFIIFTLFLKCICFILNK